MTWAKMVDNTKIEQDADWIYLAQDRDNWWTVIWMIT
jgi:hypothetical protein